MKCVIKRKNELNVSNWGGGSTTELFIFPENCHYKDKNFDFRISTATVEKSPSQFTKLCFNRILMPLNAPLRLNFGGKEVNLSPFEPIEFRGEADTVSHGVCTDIGIMFSDSFDGKLTALSGGVLKCKAGFTGIYALADNVKVKDNILMRGDFLIFKTDIAKDIIVNLPAANTAVAACVWRK